MKGARGRRAAGFGAGMVFLLFLSAGTAVANAEPVCLSCHDTAAVRQEYRKIPGEWRRSWHARHGVACQDCHGGDPQEAALAMSPERGFKGVPAYSEVPEFCGGCHVGVLKSYLESKHGRALKKNGSGPTCVTCHGSHSIEKASIDLINEERCTQCHSYERAGTIRDALSSTEKRLDDLREKLRTLERQGVYIGKLNKTFFAVEASFRIVFHTVDVPALKAATDEVVGRVDVLEKTFADIERDLTYRKWFSGTLMLVFLCLAVVLRSLSAAKKL